MAQCSCSPGKKSILIISSNSETHAQIALSLTARNYAVESAANPEEYDRCIHNGPVPHLVFLDADIPGSDTLQTIENWKKRNPTQMIIALSAAEDVRTVVETIRAGAVDYVIKPWDEAKLASVLQQYLPGELIPEKAPAPVQAETIQENTCFEDLGNRSLFMAASPSMKQIRMQLPLIAKVDVPALVLGESGVGKEVVVRLIHKLSDRANRPLLKVNCAALPADLLESELFGYEAGAFTGAVRSKPGKFELCDGGAILLDEIGEMSPAMQAKLLHVLQDGRYSRLGGRLDMRPDVRVYATTNIDMEKAIAAKTFREDLYYRLSAFTLSVPPLRERRAEIPLLFNDFMSRCSSTYGCAPLEYSQTLAAACMRHLWPGNIRELENFVKRYIILRDASGAISELAGRSRSKSGLQSFPRNQSRPASSGFENRWY